MPQLIECVPNFSEGRDPSVIRAITAEIEAVEGAHLLDVDPGKATNRTVVTFAGDPEPVIEAAVRSARKASELIDMRSHHGEHPRFGALDVCPLVPVSGIGMDETVVLARELGRRLGEEVGLTVFLYEHAASAPHRRNLADVRAGEYEGLAAKLADPRWKPDFGAARFEPRTGATAVGARDFLVAYNVNLNTTSTRRANAIAYDVREKGRIVREGDPVTGKIVCDARGEPVWRPGSLKCVKAIGWFIEEYGIAQISINLTNLRVTPVHDAFDEVCKRAEARGVRVTGSELVGLVPLEAMLEAGRHFLRKQQRSLGVSDRELVDLAVRSLGLAELRPFDPHEKILEWRLADRTKQRLVDRTLERFVEETASESPAPGGGSVSAAVGALAAALGTMVANLSAHKPGCDERWEEFSRWAERGKRNWVELVILVDRDTEAFRALMAAFGLPKQSDAEKSARKLAIQAATRAAIEAPLRTMEVALESMDVLAAMASEGLPASVSDAGVGALCARAAVRGAALNVRINAKSLEDRALREEFLARAARLETKAEERERDILATVAARM